MRAQRAAQKTALGFGLHMHSARYTYDHHYYQAREPGTSSSYLLDMERTDPPRPSRCIFSSSKPTCGSRSYTAWNHPVGQRPQAIVDWCRNKKVSISTS